MVFEYVGGGSVVRLFEAEQAEVEPGARVLRLGKPRDERVMSTPQFVRPHFD